MVEVRGVKRRASQNADVPSLWTINDHLGVESKTASSKDEAVLW